MRMTRLLRSNCYCRRQALKKTLPWFMASIFEYPNFFPSFLFIYSATGNRLVSIPRFSALFRVKFWNERSQRTTSSELHVNAIQMGMRQRGRGWDMGAFIKNWTFSTLTTPSTTERFFCLPFFGISGLRFRKHWFLWLASPKMVTNQVFNTFW